MTATDPRPALAAMLAERLAPAAAAFAGACAADMAMRFAPARWWKEKVLNGALCPDGLQDIPPAHAEHDIS